MNKTSEILKQTRLEKNYTFEDIEKQTRIRKKYLMAIETEQWQQFSSLTYILGTIKTYSNFLGLGEDKMLAFFRREYEAADNADFKTLLPNKFFTPKTKKVIRLVLLTFFLVFVFYFSIQIIHYFLPPKVVILQPKREIFYTDKVHLIGQT